MRGWFAVQSADALEEWATYIDLQHLCSRSFACILCIENGSYFDAEHLTWKTYTFHENNSGQLEGEVEKEFSERNVSYCFSHLPSLRCCIRSVFSVHNMTLSVQHMTLSWPPLLPTKER